MGSKKILIEKIIFCYTGEPRSFLKGLSSRNRTFEDIDNSKYKIESRYLIGLMKDCKKKEKAKITKKLKYFYKDQYLKKLSIINKYSNNIWENLLKQKFDILYELSTECEELENSIIILTRTDWLFTKNCLGLIKDSINTRKIITPFISSSFNIYDNKRYKAIADQFMVIPGKLINEIIQAFKISYQLSQKDQNESDPNLKNLKLPGDGKNRYGNSPENLLGIGFLLSNLSKYHSISENFIFAFEPGIYNTTPHNLIRDDAHFWMNLNLKDLAIKYMFFKSNKFLKILLPIKKLILAFKKYLETNTK